MKKLFRFLFKRKKNYVIVLPQDNDKFKIPNVSNVSKEQLDKSKHEPFMYGLFLTDRETLGL